LAESVGPCFIEDFAVRVSGSVAGKSAFIKVRHAKATSFGGVGEEYRALGSRLILQLHPGQVAVIASQQAFFQV
jgi:UV DNA damage repair endonuclease